MPAPTTAVTTAAADSVCAACTDALKDLGSRGAYRYAQCTSCRSVQLDPLPTQEELDRAYSESYADSGHYGTDPDAMWFAAAPFYRSVLSALESVPRPEGGVVLDLGCGWGGMCALLAEAGIPYVGIDYESRSLDHCRSQGLNVRAGGSDPAAQPDAPFSAIVMVTVFEHLIDHDAFLQRLRASLFPGGVLVILTPTSRVFAAVARTVRRVKGGEEIPAINTTFCPPWHTFIPSASALRTLLMRNGFEDVRLSAAPSGAGRGLLGVAQTVATVVARGGHRVFGERWPFVLNHIAIARRPADG